MEEVTDDSPTEGGQNRHQMPQDGPGARGRGREAGEQAQDRTGEGPGMNKKTLELALDGLILLRETVKVERKRYGTDRWNDYYDTYLQNLDAAIASVKQLLQ